MREYICGGALALILASGCGSKLVGIGHGMGGTAGAGGAAEGGSGDEMVGVAAKGGSLVNIAGLAAAGGDESVNLGGDGSGGEPNPGPDPNAPQVQSSKLDLLLAVDNSLSMRDKQELLAEALPALIGRLINPACVDDGGHSVAQPDSPDGPCPAGSSREIAPLRDLHVGVVTSSLGSHGASGPEALCAEPSADDHAYLLPKVRSGLTSYDNQGYLKWDPAGQATPPGQSDPQIFIDDVKAMVQSAGETGCGFEAQLESVYRFLVDPEPALAVVKPQDQDVTFKQGIDTALLQQRERFLRPDSSVVVLMLTDENDCSIVDEGYGWLLARQDAQMFAATPACAIDPNDPCCQSCAETQPNPGCNTPRAEASCANSIYLQGDADPVTLRCFEQKRRFGLDLLYPLSRYVQGFGGYKVRDHNGTLVENPLFHRNGTNRSSTLFTFAFMGGVPWQDLATPATYMGEPLEYLSAEQLAESKRWPAIVGEPSLGVPPTDPFMQESIGPRSGTNPFTGASIVSGSQPVTQSNPINGHESHLPMPNDLQYACTYELAEPIVCDQQAFQDGRGCDCFQEDLDTGHFRSVCERAPGGGGSTTTQLYGKAYPSLRQLAVSRDLGRRSVVGSVCAPNNNPSDDANYGYAPMVRSLTQRLKATLVKP